MICFLIELGECLFAEHTSDTETVWRTMSGFLIELLVRQTWFRQFDKLHSQLDYNEMQASAQTCSRRTADSMIKNIG